MAQRRLHVHGLDTKVVEIEDDNGLEVMTVNTVTPGVVFTGSITQTGNLGVTGNVLVAGEGTSIKAPLFQVGDDSGATTDLTFYAYSDDELSVPTEYTIEIAGGIVVGVTATPVAGGE